MQLASFREEELIDRVEALATSFGCDSAGKNSGTRARAYYPNIQVQISYPYATA